MKKVLAAFIALFMVGSVSAIYCDEQEQFEEWYIAGDLQADLNEDGFVTLSDWVLFSTVCEERPPYIPPEPDAPTSSRNRWSLDDYSSVRIDDTGSKNERHRFYLDREEYTLNMVFQRYNPFERFIRWFAPEKADFKVYNEEGDILYSEMVTDGLGSFELDGKTINYEVEEGRNIALKEITLELEE